MIKPTFESFLASGTYDHATYYALVAPIGNWSLAHPTHCIAEPVPGIVDEGWGVVTWHTVLYAYSTEAMALRRAKVLGKKVRPLELRCLSCFAHIFSAHFPFTDLILDEVWHVNAFSCEHSQHERVAYLQLDDGKGLYRLLGCEGRNDLHWEPSEGRVGTLGEECDPMPFPGNPVMIDRSDQGGPVDMEMLSPPTDVRRFFVDGRMFGRRGEAGEETIFSRPVDPIAFADLRGEKIILTYGDGAWIPVAWRHGNERRLASWAGGLKDTLKTIWT